MNTQKKPRFYKSVDLSRLPVEFNSRNSAGWLGPVIMIFAIFWGGMPTAVLVTSISQGTFEPGMLLVLFFTGIGIGAFVLGLALTFSRTRYKITSDMVFCTLRKFRKSECWQESLANYQGVAMRSEYHSSSGRRGSSYTLYIVELRHIREEKTVLLYQSQSDQHIREIWENSAKALREPALEFVDGKLQRRELEDLDKSVRELMLEEKVKWQDVTLETPPEGIKVAYDQGFYVLTISHCNAPLSVMKALGFVVLGFIGFFAMVGLYWMGILAFFGAAWLTFWLYGIKTEFRMNSKHVEKFSVYPWGKQKTVVLQAKEIEGVQFKSSADTEGMRCDRLVIATDRKGSVDMSTGWITHETLEWLRSAMLKILAM